MASYSGGRYSKFQQRLRNIYMNRLKRKKLAKEVQDEFVKEKIQEIKKELSVSDNKVDSSRERLILSRSSFSRYLGDEFNLEEEYKQETNREVDENTDKKDVEQVSSNDLDSVKNVVIDEVESIKDKGLVIDKEKKYIKKRNNFISDRDILKNELIKIYGIEIIEKLKIKFIEKSAEIDVLESELFLISQLNDENLELEKAKLLKQEINKKIDEINLIIEQYNLYNSRSSLEMFMGIDDKYLEDSIIKYRDMLGSFGEEKNFVKEYKLLDEFNSLYFNLKNIKNDVIELEVSNEEKIEEYNIRDKKYDDIKFKLCNVDKMRRNFSLELDKQNKYLETLMKNVDHITKMDYTTDRLVGVLNYLMSGIKFFGLSLLSPLSGLIPSISVNTLIAKNAVKNAYNLIHVETTRHIYYKAFDYDREISGKINDISYTENIVDSTLLDVKNLKKEFLSIYDSNVSGYNETLASIIKIEDMIYKNQCKVNVIKKKLGKSREINRDKMIKVKKLNENGS